MTKKKNPAQSPLETARSRWRCWLGQKTRWDKPRYLDLLNSNWLAWADSVLGRRDLSPAFLGFRAEREEIKDFYAQAINLATMQDLRALDALYCEQKGKR